MIKKGLVELLKKYPHIIDEISDETSTNDGYWIYFKPGFQSWNETHLEHEYTIDKLKYMMRRVAVCNCSECRNHKD